MADKGPGPNDLIRKRITTDIMRFQFQIASQELEMMEKLENIERLKDNIKASHVEVEKQERNLAALDNPPEGSEEG